MSSNSIIIKLFNSNQTENKFLKNTRIQNFTIFENFQFFFKFFLDTLTIMTDAQHHKNIKRTHYSYLSSTQLEVTLKKKQ